MILDDEIYSMANCDHTLTLYGKNVAPTLTSRMGTGGNQVPVFVVNKNRANTLRANAGAIKHMADLKGRTVIEGVNYQGCKSASNTFKDTCPTLEATHGHDVHVIKAGHLLHSRIRRLTPLECERLQGLPDGWTDVPSVDKKGNTKPASDSSRYKAIGNGMAQPCADFVLRQIAYYARVSENEVD